MVSELRWELRKMKNGGLRVTVTSISKNPDQILKDQRAYCEKFRRHLKAAGEYNKVYVFVNSPGGSVNSALGMAYVLDHDVPKDIQIRTLVAGHAGSAATLLLDLRGECYITETSTIYIHKSRSEKFKKKEGLWEKIFSGPGRGWVNTLMATAYSDRMRINGKKRNIKEIKTWMREGKRFTAREAFEAGLCDGIMSQVEFEKG